jgi:hypothetical protein
VVSLDGAKQQKWRSKGEIATAVGTISYSVFFYISVSSDFRSRLLEAMCGPDKIMPLEVMKTTREQITFRGVSSCASTHIVLGYIFPSTA